MNVSTHVKQVKVHTLMVDDAEIEAHLDDPDYWPDTMRDLLLRKVEPAKQLKRTKKRDALTPQENEIACPKCGMPVTARGLAKHQSGAKCRLRAESSSE